MSSGSFSASMHCPALLGVCWRRLPFIDRNPERNIFKRPIALIGWVVLTVSILCSRCLPLLIEIFWIR